ncbi:hypothetical protein [Aquamicrobium terrae]
MQCNIDMTGMRHFVGHFGQRQARRWFMEKRIDALGLDGVSR